MEHRISHDNMDDILKKLEDDYIQVLVQNESTTVEDFIEQFLYDSWDYNHQNMDLIKAVMRRYSQGDVHPVTFSGAFKEMADHLQKNLAQLDHEHNYPMLHTGLGTTTLVAIIDGMVVQYYTGTYSIEDLKNKTPQLKSMILNALSTQDMRNL
ncbi:hypothetical protein [Pontibacillus yanchengensis]|uniref:TetR family transcriptional regulator n=1 Tax=Pontibacillus yanchengensis Y32 TaxID=1385514 RepID=A0A0A2TC93_9BACI|nr:hypothetical protein [Pontibacillus yanchengensis]KGP73422.1 hypothetical protein N782_05075 [Pontibacillus yanchengensis Y32]